MKSFALLLAALFLASAAAFAPQSYVQGQSSALFATHVNDKAAKWCASKRPKKSRMSDINRAPIIYALDSLVKPSEYTISEAAATPVVKPPTTEN